MNCVQENTFENEIKSSKTDIILYLYGLYFILKPFYFWSSGLPQISDFILVFLMFVFFIKKRFRISFKVEAKNFIIAGLLFVSYIVLINLTWALILGSTSSFLKSPLFYIYNFFVSLLVIVLFTEYKEKLFKITYKAVIISVFIQILMYVINGGYTGGRMTGGFNNPNQLGYYSLLVMSILMFLSNRINVKVKWFILAIFSSLLLLFASLSKAAIVSSFGLIFFFILSKNNNKKFKRRIISIFVLLILVLTFVYQTTNIIQENQLLQSVQQRINGIGKDSDDSPEGRGYNRITDYPQYWIFGSGEGELIRFGIEMEFHSTLGNIQVSYGIIGLILFLSILYLSLRNDGFKSWYIIAFIMIYGLTHNGIRNSMLWILLSLVLMEASPSESKK